MMMMVDYEMMMRWWMMMVVDVVFSIYSSHPMTRKEESINLIWH